MSSREQIPDITFEPELRADMNALSTVSFEDLAPGDRLIVLTNGGNHQAALYRIDVEKITPEGMEAYWITWWSFIPEWLINPTNQGDVFKNLDNELVPDEIGIHEHQGLILGTLCVQSTQEGKYTGQHQELGYLKASRPTEHQQLIFERAYNIREDRLDTGGAQYWSNSVRNIYLAKAKLTVA